MTKKHISLVLLILALPISGFTQNTGNFTLRAGTGFGWQGPARINKGYYYGKDVNKNSYNNEAIYDFKNKLYFTLGGTMRYKNTEWLLEFGKANYHSDVTVLQRRTEADLKFVNMTFAGRYVPFQTPLHGFRPFAEVGLNFYFYTYDDYVTPDVTNPNNGVPIEESNYGMAPRFSFYAGTDYYFSKMLGAYAKFGYGFEFCQVGIVGKFFDRDAD